VDILTAPGEPIVSTAAGVAHATNFAPRSGTSLAAAHVTGAVALMLEASPNCTRAAVVDCLRRTARSDHHTRLGPATAWGVGKLDIAAALESI
jgi:subtilisin family serine protease